MEPSAAAHRGAAARALQIRGLRVRAGSFELRELSLELPAGSVLAVLGPSGAGKTVLLETLAGFRRPLAGRIELDGRELTALAPERRAVGFVPQDAALFPHLSVRENVRFGLRAAGCRALGRADELLCALGVDHLAARAPSTLSGGERQRVALARALATNPRLLALDEPFSALDAPTREGLREHLRELLPALGIPVMLVTHDRDEARVLGDRLAVLIGGRLRQAGPAEAVLTSPCDAEVARLLGMLELRLDGAPPRYYRPEEVLLGRPALARSGGIRLRLAVERIEPAGAALRIVLGPRPRVAALAFARELPELGVAPGAVVDVNVG